MDFIKNNIKWIISILAGTIIYLVLYVYEKPSCLPVGISVASFLFAIMSSKERKQLSEKFDEEKNQLIAKHGQEKEKLIKNYSFDLRQAHSFYCLHFVDIIKSYLDEECFEEIPSELEVIEDALLKCKGYCQTEQKKDKFLDHRTGVRQWIMTFSLYSHGNTNKKGLTKKEKRDCIEFLEKLVEFLKDECN